MFWFILSCYVLVLLVTIESLFIVFMFTYTVATWFCIRSTMESRISSPSSSHVFYIEIHKEVSISISPTLGNNRKFQKPKSNKLYWSQRSRMKIQISSIFTNIETNKQTRKVSLVTSTLIQNSSSWSLLNKILLIVLSRLVVMFFLSISNLFAINDLLMK